MRRPTTGVALVAVAVSLGSLSSCGLGGEDYALSSTDVQRAVATEVRAGTVEVALPVGAATGGRLAVQEGPRPENVPAGVVPVSRQAVVSLFEGTLDGPLQVSFDPPPELTAEHVPVVMATDDQGEWHWRPTSWEGGTAPVTAELVEPGQVFLARFDRAPWLAELGDDFAAKVNDPARLDAPTCGDEDAALEDGVEVSSEPGEVLLWCAGVDTVAPASEVDGLDVDYATEGVQAEVLRLTNGSRMFQEVGYPAEWPAVDGPGDGALAGQTLRDRLGLAGSTRDGLATRVLAPGDTLTLALPADPAGTVTADLSAAAWTISAIDFATSSYTRLVSVVDRELGQEVRAARTALLDQLVAPSAAQPGDEDGNGDLETLSAVSECLAPVAGVVLMNPDAAQDLVDEVFPCVPTLLRPALADRYDRTAAAMADGVGTTVLGGLPASLAAEPEPWSRIADASTDAEAGFQLWVGPPPAKDYDYTDSPHVFRPGDEVAVAEWSPEFAAYVEERLAALSGDGTATTTCPEAAFTVTRYRSDGFAQASEVSCTDGSWRLVLGRSSVGWTEIDDIQQDAHFGCSVLGTYAVPAFIAGDTCLDGEQTQEYTG